MKVERRLPFGLVVCAQTADEAREWARQHGLSEKDYVYASAAARLDGMRDFAVIRLAGFYRRRDRGRIEETIRRNELKMGGTK